MFEKFIAYRYLRIRKDGGFAYVVSWFSLIGISLGVATLIIVTSVMNGFKEELFGKIVGMKGHISIASSNYRKINDFENISNNIKESCPQVESVVPIIEKQAILMSNGNVQGVFVHGITANGIVAKKIIAKNIKDGKLEQFSGNRIFIGSKLARILNIWKDSKITLMFPGGLKTPIGSFPKQEEFTISGIFEVGMNDYDSGIVLMPLDTAQKFFGIINAVTQFEVFLKNQNAMNMVTSTLSTNFDNLSILDWQHSDANIFHAVTVEKNVMSLILGIIVLVAVFNIISSLTMLTNSKRKDIGILRTMGATQKSIMKIFFFIGASIGIIGTFIGTCLGLVVSLNIDSIKRFLESLSGCELFSEEIYFLSRIPSKTDYVEVIIIAGFSLFLCFLATIYPSMKAARLDPVDCLN